MVEIKHDEKLRYGQFVGLLNVIRGRGLMSAEQRREYDKRWRDFPDDRDLVLQELERIMEEHSERLIKERREK